MRKLTPEQLADIRGADDRVPKNLVERGYGIIYEQRRALLDHIDALTEELETYVRQRR